MSLETAALPPPVKQALSRFGHRLRQRFGERLCEVVLFGSYARGDADEDSDVDVLVVVDDLTEPERRDIFELAHAVDATDSDAWVGLSVIAHGTAQAEAMRRAERRLYRDIDGEGMRV